MHIGFKPAVGAAFCAAIAITAVLAILAGIASAQPTTAAPSFSYATASSQAIGASSGDTATIVDNVIISGSVTGDQYVNFYDESANPAEFLGTARLYSSTDGSNQTGCSTQAGSNKAPCTARITILGTQLASGANDIEAQYAGDHFIQGTNANVTVYQGPEASCTLSLSTTCLDSNTAADATSSASFTSNSPKTGNEQVVLAFGAAQTIGCIGAGPSVTSDSSDLLAYNVSNSGGINQLSYTIYGSAATTIDTAYPAGLVCYEAPAQFTAVNFPRANPTVPETCADASACSLAPQQMITDSHTGTTYGLGLYYGYLPNCLFASKKSTTPALLPCIVSVAYKSPSKARPASYAEFVDSNQNDPLVAHH
ncbi:MAG TPA: hypothetical protein VG405_05025 [Solirubrobacteraceae bacterium]|nr:hypothetical protein [Solirubrobacteraceae bacterium]